MSGLLRRLTRRRPATADETGTPEPASSEPVVASAETPAEPGGEQPVATDEQATQVLPATGEQTIAIPAAAEAGETVTAAPVRDLPAGVDPSEYADAPLASAPRGKLRRRLRYLRRVRELLLRDLGGFTFEIHRTAGGHPADAHRRLAEAKVHRIAALDTEVRALEERLGEPHEVALLREPGIGGTCPECGELHATDAHYCARCGAPLDAKARARRDAAVAAAAEHTTGSHAPAEPAHASVLWAAGPRPAAKTEGEEPEEQPRSEVTSQWLALPRHEEPARAADEPAAESAPEAPESAPEAAAAEAAKSAPEAAEGAPEAPESAPEAAAAEAADTAPEEPESASEAAEADEPKLEPAGEDPAFEPTPNGRPAEDVPDDAMTSQQDKAS